MEIRSLVSGMPREMRKRARLIVFQAWFDDSGKAGPTGSPIYLLAGYSARVPIWEDFADDWQAELDQEPKLEWLHATEAYNLNGQFGFDKETKTPSPWIQAHDRRNETARDERLLKFARIISKHLRPDTDSYGVTWLLKHDEYAAFIKRLKSLRTATLRDIGELNRFAKNPSFLSFQKVLGQELKLRVAQGIFLGRTEKTEILFDCGIDNPANLEEAFAQFMKVLELDDPRFLKFFQNTKPEYRDDKYNPPLQAADLLSWHLGRMCLEVSRGATEYNDPVYVELRRSVKYWDYRYEAKDWERILTRIRVNALLDLGIVLPRPR